VNRRAFIPCVPGAAQHEATAQWCAADPGSLRTPSLERSRISGAPLHFAPRCTASGTRVIGRRGVISLLIGAAAALACPLPLRAQQPQGRPLIGVLSPISAALAARNMEALRQGLREFGYVEGRNIGFEFRYAEGDLARLRALAAELVALQPAVIIAGSAPGALAAREATRAIPIVMADRMRRRAFITRVPGAAQHEPEGEWRAADPGSFRSVAVPDQRCTASLCSALHRIRDTRSQAARVHHAARQRGGVAARGARAAAGDAGDWFST
jgi:hypothetical protein